MRKKAIPFTLGTLFVDLKCGAAKILCADPLLEFGKSAAFELNQRPDPLYVHTMS